MTTTGTDWVMGENSNNVILGIVLGAVGLGVGLLALVAFLVLSIVVWHHWRKSKGELLSLRYQLDKAVAQPGSVVDPNLIPLAQLPSERPSSPPSQPKPIIVDDIKGSGYSSVNKLSLLPDSVRTTDNLETKTIPTEAEEKLLEKYLKERKEYEEQQLQKCEGMKANRDGNAATPANPTSATPANPTSALGKRTLSYETITFPEGKEKKVVCVEGNDYGQPVDALEQPVQTPVAAKPLTNMQQRNVVNADLLGQAYTPVYQPQQEGGQGGMRQQRSASDIVSPRHTYENSSKANMGEDPRRTEGVKGGPNRRMAKEVVEFDPEKQRMFRMTSQKGRRGGGGKESGADQTDDARKNETPSEKPLGSEERPSQARPAICLDYALVNMADKKKNRVGEDIAKSEGSGIPQHVVVPVMSS